MRQEPVPLISVVMPAYNVEKFIAEAIESVQAQTMPDWELVVADDCSADFTRDVVAGFAERDSRIRLIKRNSNSGGCRIPRFDAIVASRGKWICTLDADDAIEPEMFEKLLRRQNETGADMVLNRIVICDENLRETSVTLPAKEFDMGQILSGREAIKYTIDGWKISVTCALISAESYKRYLSTIDKDAFNGPFSDELDHRKMLLTADRIAFADAHYYYRQQPQSIVHNVSAKSYKGIINMINLLDFIKDIAEDDKEVIQQMHSEYVKTIYRYQVKYFIGSCGFSKEERSKINKLLERGYRRIGIEGMHFDDLKSRLLASCFLMFKTIAYMAALYTRAK